MARMAVATFLAYLALSASVAAVDALPGYIEPDDATGSSAAVVIGDWPLVHTGQVPAAGSGSSDADEAAQVQRVLEQLDLTLQAAGSDLDHAVKLNYYVARTEVVEVVLAAMASRFSGQHKPAVSFVETPLYDGLLVAADAIATTSLKPGSVQHGTSDGTGSYSVTPSGTRLYIAGQAERSESLAEATRKTLGSLRKTLQFLGGRDRDVVQLKAFLMPTTDVDVVQREIEAFYGDLPTPPTVFVEWQSGATVPIEIEMIAWGGRHKSGDAVEFLTPPDMTSSPVFSRVARVNQTRSIYVSGLYGLASDTPDDPASGEREVNAVFKSLDSILRRAGSDLRHLVKATYYVSTDAASSKLNELRPNYYDPKRPPSASKARVAGVGRARRGLSIDMIAVSAHSEKSPEYGPPEHGHGLSAQDAAEGWISLFDGRTTWGWQDGAVEDGVLSSGITTTAFGPCDIRGNATTAGSIAIGGIEARVAKGPFTLTAEAEGPIRLGSPLKIDQLALRPRGLEPIFNGRDMTDWMRIDRQSIPKERRPVWQVQDGALRATGGPGCVEYQGAKFGDMVLQLDVRTRLRHANGGVFFRAIPGDFMNGYEAQVYSKGEDGDPAKPAVWCTGGIDDRQNARRLVSRDGHFFRMTIIARGPHIATWVNGFQQVDWTDTRAPHENPREGLRVEAGALQLQAHDPGTDVEFKNIAVASWDE